MFHCLTLLVRMGIWQKCLGSWARWWNTEIKVNPTQVSAHLAHPVVMSEPVMSFLHKMLTNHCAEADEDSGRRESALEDAENPKNSFNFVSIRVGDKLQGGPTELTPEIKVFYLLFDRSISSFSMTSLK